MTCATCNGNGWLEDYSCVGCLETCPDCWGVKAHTRTEASPELRIDLHMVRMSVDDNDRYRDAISLAYGYESTRRSGGDMDQCPDADHIMETAGLPDTYTPADIVAWDKWRTSLSDAAENDGHIAPIAEVA